MQLDRQFTAACLGALAMGALFAIIAAAPDPNVSHLPALSLNGKTNVISDNGTNVTRDGVIIGGTPTGAAGGALNGNYPNPQIASGVSTTNQNLVTPTMIGGALSISQSGTNLVISLSANTYQLITLTADANITTSNISSLGTTIIDMTAGTTNRNLSFDSSFVWFSPVPSVLSSNHVGLLALTPTVIGMTNSIRASFSSSYP